MRYHNTKTTVATIIFVVASLFLISSLGIIYLNAKTPIEAVTQALSENLELPSDYSIQITDINKSFFRQQKIDNISIVKNDETFLSMDNVELNQSIFAYIRLFFKSQKTIDLKINSLDINYNKNFSDLRTGFKGFKIKDGTFSLQDESSNKNKDKTTLGFNELRSDIVEKGSVDLSYYLPDIFKNIQISLEINQGNIFFDNDSTTIEANFDSSSLIIDDNSYLKSIKTNLNNLKFISKESQFMFDIDDIELNLKKTQIDLKGSKIILANNDINASLNFASLSYSLLDMESIVLNYDKVKLSYKGLESSIESGNSRLISNLKDASIYNSFNDLVVLKNDLSIKLKTIALDASFVDKNLSILLKSGINNNIVINDQLNLGFSDLEIRATSDNFILNKVLLTAPNLQFNSIPATVGFDNLKIYADTNAKYDDLFDENNNIDFSLFDFNDFIKSYKDLKLTISGRSKGSIKALQSDFSGDLTSSIQLENEFKEITASVSLDDNYLSKVTLPVNASVAYQGPTKLDTDTLKMIEASISIGDSLVSNVVVSSTKDIFKSTIRANVELNNFDPNTVGFYTNQYLPFISTYISEKTILDGSYNFSGKLDDNSFFKSQGDINSQLIVNNLIFGETPINIGFSMSSILKEQSFEFEKLAINSFGYRLFASGIYDNLTKIPTVSMNISNVESGKKMVTAKIFNDEGKYAFNLLIPDFEKFDFSGSINNFNNHDINFDTVISFLDDTIPLNVDFDRDNYQILANSSDNLKVDIKIGKTIDANLKLSNFFINSLDSSYLNGDFSFNFAGGKNWNFNASDFALNYNKDKINVGFDTSINANQVNIENFVYQNNSNSKNQNNTYDGFFKYKRGIKQSDMRFTPYSLNINLGDGRNQNMDIVASTKGYSNDIYIDVSDFNFAPILQLDDDLIFNMRLIGNRDKDGINNFDGTINLYDRVLKTETEIVAVKESNRATSDFIFKTLSLLPFIDVSSFEANNTTNSINKVISSTNFSLDSKIEVNKDDYKLSSLNLKAGDFNITESSISFNSLLKEIGVNSTVSILKHSKNTNQLSSLNLNLNLNLNSAYEFAKSRIKLEFIDEENKLNLKSVFNSGRKIFTEKKIDYTVADGIFGSLKIDNISALKDTTDFEKFWPDTKEDEIVFGSIDTDFIVENEVIKIDGLNLNGSIDLNEKNALIDLNKNFGIGFNADIDYSNSKVNLLLNNIYFPINILSRYLYINTFKFYGGSIFGEVQITDAIKNPKFFGNLYLNEGKLKALWLDNQEVNCRNINLVAFNNRFEAKDIGISIYNSEDNKISRAIGNMSFDISKNLPFGMAIDINILDYVKGVFPILGYNMWAEGYAKNTLHYSVYDSWNTINGNLIVKDAEIKGELEPLPSWLSQSLSYTVDFNIETENNVTINYPTIDNPILKATLDKGQEIHFYIDKKLDEMYAEGNLSIAQGEIFYFQKNFFINDGEIKLNKNSTTNKLDILLSLNATLKEFDSEGNSVDILLSLNNSSLNNINPVFSASPAKSQNEIISILGESLTGSQSSGDIKVSGLASAATSIFSSLGYLGTGGVGALNQTIANTLNLDIFSLNSNIVENLLLDTINITSSTDNFSPLATYLNNTSIYMGKYISDNSYFQLIINLLADSSTNKTSFLASDLSLDLEITYDIDTPLAKFSLFTNPTQLSIIDILDTIGLSVTKTFQFR